MKGEEIKKYRKENGLTQEEFANLLGITKRTVINYEKGELIPDSKVKLLSIVMNKSKGNVFKEPTTKYEVAPKVPYYDVEFTAGFLEVFNNQTSTPTSYITHPFFKGCDCVVRASGQSMAKVIKHGDAVGLKKIPNWFEFLPFGELYGIITKNGFNTLKVISKGDTEDSFTLISKPMESKIADFPPQQIKKENILAVFSVKANSHLF